MIIKQGNRYLIDGSVTLENVEALIEESVVIDGDNVVVDLAGVVRADSSLVSLLLEWVRRFRASGRQIAFTHMGRNLQSLADLYGVTDLIPVLAV